MVVSLSGLESFLKHLRFYVEAKLLLLKPELRRQGFIIHRER